METGLVSPLNPAAVPPQPAEVAPTDPNAAPPADTGIPDEVLQLPSMQAIMTGAPPAVSARIEDYNKRPEGQMIAAAKGPLMQAGVGFYKSLSGEYGVLFNSLKISGQDIQAADKAGKLLEIAPPMDQVSAQISGSGANHPLLSAQAPGGPPLPVSASIPPSGPGMMAPPVSAPPAPASVQRGLASARLKALQPGAPTSGSKPGMGRLVNQIMKPVV